MRLIIYIILTLCNSSYAEENRCHKVGSIFKLSYELIESLHYSLDGYYHLGMNGVVQSQIISGEVLACDEFNHIKKYQIKIDFTLQAIDDDHLDPDGQIYHMQSCLMTFKAKEESNNTTTWIRSSVDKIDCKKSEYQNLLEEKGLLF